MKKYSTTELSEIAKKTPQAVQDELSSENTISVISELGMKSRLRIDQIGVLADLNVQMLLGLITPQQLQSELIAAGIPEAQAKEIISEINQKIFVPLQAKIRAGGGEQKSGSPAARPPAAGVPSYKPPTPPAPRPPQAQPAPQASRPPMPQPPPRPSAPHTPAPPPANLPGAMGDERLLSDHEVSHINVPSAPAPERPAMPQTPRPIAPMPPLPKPLPSAPPPLPQQPPAPQIKPPAPPAPKPPSDYGADPYREPIDLS